MPSTVTTAAENPRLDYLDAVRAFALLLGIVFHASLSFMPVFIGWAVMDVSTSAVVGRFVLISHAFRMELFFLIAGFFSHLAFHRGGAKAFLRSRGVRLAVPFMAGWFILRPLIVSGWVMGGASMRGDVDVWGGLREGFAVVVASLPGGLFAGSHLWFLYYLMLITALVLVMRILLKASGAGYAAAVRWADGWVGWLAGARGAVLVLAVPTTAVLWGMSGWGVDTPDQTLRPHLPALLLYGGFFVMGWAVHRRPERLDALTRVTVPRVMIAAVGVAVVLGLVDFQSQLGHDHYGLIRLGFLLGYAVAMWSLVLLTIGLFRRLAGRAHPAVRYVADASYWLYLVHLPLVVWLQIAVAEWGWPWSVKLVAICAGTIGLGLLSYDLGVRATWVGRVLNGRRRDRVLFAATTWRGVVGRVLEKFPSWRTPIIKS